ncbi:MAG: hypothetical protein ABI596_14630, partial [Pyrinomonadaceae bacterium]
MHEITGNREEVLKLMKDTIQQLGQSTPGTKKAGTRALGTRKAKESAHERDQVVAVLQSGYKEEQTKKAVKKVGLGTIPNERAVEAWYAPRNQAVALFQAAMDEYLNQQVGQPEAKEAKGKSARSLSVGGKAKSGETKKATIDAFYTGPRRPPKAGKGKTAAAKLLEQFSNLDPRWAQVVWEQTKVKLKGPRQFITHKSATDFRFQMKDECTLAIVGDWGGGNAAAQAVAGQIRKLKPD